MDYVSTDTIYALSTAPGMAAVSIIRLSGPDAHTVLKTVFFKSGGEYQERMLYYGHVRDAKGALIDEAMAVLFFPPRSYTRQPMAELHCHGSDAAIRKTFETLESAGARPALPGEFTYRAFENGRLDLSQAQAVMDVISAQGDAQRRSALSQLGGAAQKETSRMLEQVQALRAHIEVTLDYPEEDLEEQTAQDVQAELSSLLSALQVAQTQAKQGILLRQGVQAVLCGRPNAGKSALMNALMHTDRSIVTPWAGTTRDVVRDTLNIDGVTLHLSDTAGIHDTDDPVDALGVQRSRSALESADLALLVLDASREISEEDREISAMLADRPALLILNKTDLPAVLTPEQARELLPGAPCVSVSAIAGEGLDDLCSAILKAVRLSSVQNPWYTHAWQLRALQTAYRCGSQALQALRSGLDMECAATDLYNAATALGSITGDQVDEDLVNRIFSNFCIGK